MSSEGLKVIFGGGAIGNRDPFVSEEDLNELIKILEAHNATTIDSAQLYGESEKRLGEVKAGERVTIDTKWKGGWQPGGAKKDIIVQTGDESISKLGVKQVDIFYIHCPDNNTPLEETLEGVNEVYKKGYFKRFGLSNYPASEVQKAYDVAKANGWVLPTVYQGNYNPVARKQEQLLFPTLRKLNIAFYAYSPLAGGFLTKTAQQISDGAGRFNQESIGGMYSKLYARPTLLKALEKWAAIADAEGCSRAELAYRWVTYNSPLDKSHGDGIIVGASSLKQLEQTLVGLEKGPLSEKAVKGIDEIWESVKDEAPLDNLEAISK